MRGPIEPINGSTDEATLDTGVCGIKTHLDDAGVVNVPNWTCAPMCQHTRAALIKTILAHPIPSNRVIGQTMFQTKLETNFAHAECWHVQAHKRSRRCCRHWPQVGCVFISQTQVLTWLKLGIKPVLAKSPITHASTFFGGGRQKVVWDLLPCRATFANVPLWHVSVTRHRWCASPLCCHSLSVSITPFLSLYIYIYI